MLTRMRPISRCIIRAAACVALAGMLTPAANHVAHAADTPIYGGTLTLANQTDADSLDPAGNPVNEIIWAEQNLYEKLVQSSPNGTKILPQLAQSWDISKDGLTYTFHLRAAQFQNGETVTAADVVYSLDRAKVYTGGWGFLLGAVKTIVATNPNTVTITLLHPWAPFLADLAIYAFSIMPADLLKKEGAKFFDHPIGSGPYEFVSWQKGSTITLQRNPRWWGPKPYLDEVKIVNVPSDNTRVLQLEGKQADIIENPPANLLNQLASTPNVLVDLFPSSRVDFLQVDEHFPPFKDVKIRQAMNYAIDRNALVRLVLGGHGTPGASIMPPMLYSDPAIKPYPYDVTKAKALMAQSTYPKGFKTNLIEVSGDNAGNAAAVIIKSELAQIGIDVTIQDYELTTAYAKEDERNGNPVSNLGQRYWTNDIIDPQEVISFVAEPNAGANDMGTWFNNAQLNKLAKEAEVELNPAKRRALYYQIQQLSYDQAQLIVLYYQPYRYATGTWVHGFHASPLGVYQLDKIWLSAH